MEQMGFQTRCKIIIIGAGISGLTAAIALRKAGHEVHVYATSGVEDEANEAIHICPNANGILQHIGVDHEAKGAERIDIVEYYTSKGLLGSIDMKAESARWQSPWLVSRRADLLRYLDEVACSENLSNTAVRVHRGLHIVKIDPENGTVLFDNGDSSSADLIVGADGLHSAVRAAMAKEPVQNTSTPNTLSTNLSSKPTKEDQEIPVILQNQGLKILLVDDGEIVATDSAGTTSINVITSRISEYEGLNRSELLERLKNSNQCLKDYLNGSQEVNISISSLREAEIFSFWTQKRLANIGEAAYYSPPQFFYDIGLGIEDGVSLGMFLTGMKTKEEIPERLKLFKDTRLKRVSQVLELSRRTWAKLRDGHFSREDTDFVFSHDEVHHVTQVLRQHLWAKTPRLSWRQPVSFGPMTSPRQHIGGFTCSNPRPDRLEDATSLTASIRFRTSKTLLQNIFPSDAYSFATRGSVAEASFVFQSIRNLAWLGGGGYNLVLFQIHGIQHRSQANGTTREGSYVALVLEDLTDPIISGREDLGWPKLYSDIGVTDETHSGGGLSATLSWRGTKWMRLSWNDLQPHSKLTQPSQPGTENVFVHKYIPATTEIPHRQAADADYDVLMPPPSPASKPVEWKYTANSPDFHIDAGSEQQLPTLWHIASRLAELPNFGIVEAKVGIKQGQDDFNGATRV